MENGSELSKTVATFIVAGILFMLFFFPGFMVINGILWWFIAI